MTARLTNSLPDTADAVEIEEGIGADDRPARSLRLCREQAIEWVIVMPRQQASPDGVAGIDGQLGEALFGELCLPIGKQSLVLKFAEIGLDRQFPGNYRGNHNRVRPAFHRLHRDRT